MPSTGVPKLIRLKVGANEKLSLPSNPTTGYEWTVVQAPSFVKVTKEDYVQLHAGVGAGGSEEFAIKANARGEGVVSLRYSQPWSGDVAEEVDVKVVVEGR